LYQRHKSLFGKLIDRFEVSPPHYRKKRWAFAVMKDVDMLGYGFPNGGSTGVST